MSDLRLKARRNYYQFIARDQVEAEAQFHSSAEVIEMLNLAGFRQSVIRGLRPKRGKNARVFSLIKAVK